MKQKVQNAKGRKVDCMLKNESEKNEKEMRI